MQAIRAGRGPLILVALLATFGLILALARGSTPRRTVDTVVHVELRSPVVAVWFRSPPPCACIPPAPPPPPPPCKCIKPKPTRPFRAMPRAAAKHHR